MKDISPSLSGSAAIHFGDKVFCVGLTSLSIDPTVPIPTPLHHLGNIRLGFDEFNSLTLHAVDDRGDRDDERLEGGVDLVVARIPEGRILFLGWPEDGLNDRWHGVLLSVGDRTATVADAGGETIAPGGGAVTP